MTEQQFFKQALIDNTFHVDGEDPNEVVDLLIKYGYINSRLENKIDSNLDYYHFRVLKPFTLMSGNEAIKHHVNKNIAKTYFMVRKDVLNVSKLK